MGIQEQLRAAADHREGPANFVDDPGQKTADLNKLLIEHRHAGHLAKLNQTAHPPQHDGSGRVFGDIVIGPGFQPGQDVGIVVPHGQHQDGHAVDLAVGANGAADGKAVHIGQVHIENDDVRPDLPGLLDGFPPFVYLEDRVAGPAEDRSKQGAIRRAIIDDQDGTHQIPLRGPR